MDDAVKNLVHMLDAHQMNTRTQLNVIYLRTKTVRIEWQNCSKEQRSKYKSLLQQYFDLFAHVYQKKPIRVFQACHQNIG